jgi:hypothetical protein
VDEFKQLLEQVLEIEPSDIKPVTIQWKNQTLLH